MTEKKINEICKFKQFIGPKLAVVVKNLNAELRKYRFEAREKQGASYDELMGILKDRNASYPIIGLSYEYLETEVLQVRLQVQNRDSYEQMPDHAAIVLASDDSDTVLYDPYASHSKRRKQDPLLSEGIVRRPTPRVLAYWEKALFSDWMLWIRRLTGKEPDLTTYMNGELGREF